MHQAIVAGGTIIGTRKSPRAEVLTTLLEWASATESTPAERILLLGGFSRLPRGKHESVVRELAAAPTAWGQIVAYGPGSREFAKIATRSGVVVTTIIDRYTLRDVIIRHWESYRSPVLAATNSRGTNLAWAVDDALGSLLSLDAAGIAKSTTRVKTARAEFDLISGVGAIAVKSAEERPDIVLPSTVAGMGLIAVGPEAYTTHSLKTLMLSAPVRSIGTGAFRDCASLNKIVLPSSVKFIGDQAFEGNAALTSLVIPDSVRTIASRAFAGCSSLEEVVLPNGRVSIAHDAFDECHPDLRFIVEAGTTAENWAGKRSQPTDVRPTPVVYPSATRRIMSKGVEYRLLAGGMLEAWNAPDSASGTVTIPSEVEGYPLRGVGHNFVSAESRITALTLPPTITWIARDAFSPGCEVKQINVSNNIQSVGEGEIAERLVRFNPRRTRDADSVKLSLRMMCTLLDIALPESFAYLADEPFSTLSVSTFTSGVQGLHFATARALTPKNIDRLFSRGVRAFVSTGPIRGTDGAPLPYIFHPYPKEAYELLCAWIAAQYRAKTVAITGSVGKTSTKEMIHRVCATALTTLYSAKNQNGVGQVGRYVQKLSDKTEVYVQETGAGRPHLVERSARILRADAFVITNIGTNHIGNYGGSQDRLLTDKLSHDAFMPDDGVAFVNFDDPKLREIAIQHRTITYGVESRDTDYWAEDIVEKDGELNFAIIDAMAGTRTATIVNSFGRHNVSNAVASFAVGRWLGIPAEKIVAGIASYKGEGLRQNLTEVGGQRVLVDCYNSSEVAIGATADALEALSVAHSGRRIYVIGDIDDKLGSITEEVHRRVGKDLAGRTSIDRFYLFGHHASWIAEELQSRGREAIATIDREELHNALLNDLNADDVVAFKGGQQMALSITIDKLFGTSFVLSDGDVLEKRGTDVIDGSVTYRIIDEFGAELRKVRSESGLADLAVASSQEGQPVLMIGRAACASTQLKSVSIPEPVRTLAPAAFYQARLLEHIEFPPTLKTIGSSAFNGCLSLQHVVVPEGVTTIGSRAFYRCSGLNSLVLPASVQTIEPEVFAHCGSLTVECPLGSYSERHLRETYPDVNVIAS